LIPDFALGRFSWLRAKQPKIERSESASRHAARQFPFIGRIGFNPEMVVLPSCVHRRNCGWNAAQD